MRRGKLALSLAALSVGLIACSGGGDDGGGGNGAGFLGDINEAVAAVEEVRGGPQAFFEVTANQQLTNVFVAVDGATAAIPYVFIDGELEEPGPVLEGASGQTFSAAAIEFDADEVLGSVSIELPGATIDAFSVEGAPLGNVRYVVSVRSTQGGALDVTVGPSGVVLAVDPI